MPAIQLNIPQAYPAQIDLPVPKDPAWGCPRAVRVDLDNLLLAIEALDLQATEIMLYLVQQLDLESVIPNRVSLWRLRNTNPLRRNYQRATLQWDEAQALVKIICVLARQLNTQLRLLVTTSQQVSENKIDILGLQQNRLYLEFYLDRFRSLFLSRMRSPSILSDREIEDLSLHLLSQLLFCSGTAGELRLWHSLLDGVIA